MSTPAVLVVGAGQAAVQFAATLRERGFDGSITLVGAGHHLPYQRPPLSKGFLKGTATAQSLALRAESFYDDQRIGLVLGESVTAVTRGADGSGTATTDRGTVVDFDRLVLATGARPRQLPLPGADAAGVLQLANLDDAEALLEALPTISRLVVIGGGFIGLEVAATARGLGIDVTVLEARETLMGRAVGLLTAERMLAVHQDLGTRILLGAEAERIITGPDGRVTGVDVSGGDVSGGEVVDADLVLIGVGAVPNTELAEQLGLACADGILVDEFSLTSDQHTLAVGDCCAVPDPTPGAGGARIRLESVDNAIEQAKSAAATASGVRSSYRSIPWFWSDQGPAKLQIAGLRLPGDRAVDRPHPTEGKSTVGYFRDGRLSAVETINAPADFMTLRKALASGVHLEPEELADPQVNLKTLVAGRTATPAG